MRDYSGRVFLQGSSGKSYQLRTDAKVPGMVLLRDPSGMVFYITYNNIQQVDLSDDYVVSAIFGNTDWEAGLQPVQALDKDGQLVTVQLDKIAFEDLVSIMS